MYLATVPLGDGQAKLEQFAADSWSTPERIGTTHLADQVDGVWSEGFPAGFARTALSIARRVEIPLDAIEVPCWVELGAAGSSIRPRRAKAKLKGPGPAASGVVAWSSAQREQLVSQGQDLQEQGPARFKPGNGHVKHGCHPTNHATQNSGKCLRACLEMLLSVAAGVSRLTSPPVFLEIRADSRPLLRFLKHALRSPVFSHWMRFLPTTGAGRAALPARGHCLAFIRCDNPGCCLAFLQKKTQACAGRGQRGSRPSRRSMDASSGDRFISR